MRYDARAAATLRLLTPAAWVAIVACATLEACSSSGSPPTVQTLAPDATSPIADASAMGDASPPLDAAVDALPHDVVPDPTGSLTARAAGTYTTTAKLGAFTPTRGSAQLRPNPTSGGILSSRFEESAPQGTPSREVEVTLYDDVGALTAGESFNGEPRSGIGLRRARVEMYQSDGKRWGSDGDGTVKVTAIDTTSVTLTLNIGLFRLDGDAGVDVFTLDGTVTVALHAFSPRQGVSTVSLSGVLPEPISNDPPNMVSASQGFNAICTLSDSPYPYVGDRRTVTVTDAVGATPRTLRIAFPSGHLPHVGLSYPLNDFSRVQVSVFENTYVGAPSEKLWEADRGAFSVTAATSSQMTIALTGARMQSESPSAKGLFVLDGAVTFALP